MTDLQMAQTLRSTAGYLRLNGWRQDDYGAHGGGRCLVGAMQSAAGMTEEGIFPGDFEDTDWFYELREAMRFVATPPTTWNDSPGRTVEEVLDRLESTALALEVRALAAENVSANPELPVVAEIGNFAKVAV